MARARFQSESYQPTIKMRIDPFRKEAARFTSYNQKGQAVSMSVPGPRPAQVERRAVGMFAAAKARDPGAFGMVLGKSGGKMTAGGKPVVSSRSGGSGSGKGNPHHDEKGRFSS